MPTTDYSSGARYGSSCNLVLSTGSGVNGYTLDVALGEFILTHPDVCSVFSGYTFRHLDRAAQIKIPPRGKIYSFNEGNSMYFHPPVNAYLSSIKHPKAGSPYSARYIGSMVADVHRTLLYGGIFGYPDDKKSKSGKLRMLYEAFPMAFLTEQVCGREPRSFVAHLDDRVIRQAVLRPLGRSAFSTSSPRTSTSDARYSWVVKMTFWI